MSQDRQNNDVYAAIEPSELNDEAIALLVKKTVGADGKTKTIAEAIVDGTITTQTKPGEPAELDYIIRAIKGNPYDKKRPYDKVTGMIEFARAIGPYMSDAQLFKLVDQLVAIEVKQDAPFRGSMSLAKAFITYELDRHLRRNHQEIPAVFMHHMNHHIMPWVQAKQGATIDSVYSGTVSFNLLQGSPDPLFTEHRFPGITDTIKNNMASIYSYDGFQQQTKNVDVEIAQLQDNSSSVEPEKVSSLKKYLIECQKEAKQRNLRVETVEIQEGLVEGEKRPSFVGSAFGIAANFFKSKLSSSQTAQTTITQALPQPKPSVLPSIIKVESLNRPLPSIPAHISEDKARLRNIFEYLMQNAQQIDELLKNIENKSPYVSLDESLKAAHKVLSSYAVTLIEINSHHKEMMMPTGFSKWEDGIEMLDKMKIIVGHDPYYATGKELDKAAKEALGRAVDAVNVKVEARSDQEIEQITKNLYNLKSSHLDKSTHWLGTLFRNSYSKDSKAITEVIERVDKINADDNKKDAEKVEEIKKVIQSALDASPELSRESREKLEEIIRPVSVYLKPGH